MNSITSLDAFYNFLAKNEVVLLYFSTPQCNVCKVLKPKIIDLINQEFPKIKLVYIDSSEQQDIAAQNSVFTAPTILVFIEGKEFLRSSRNINISEFQNSIKRLYSMFFE